MRLRTGLLLSLAVVAVILVPGLLGSGRDADDTAVHTGSIAPPVETASDAKPSPPVEAQPSAPLLCLIRHRLLVG